MTTLIGILALYVCYRFIKWWHSFIDNLNNQHQQKVKYEVSDVKKVKLFLEA